MEKRIKIVGRKMGEKRKAESWQERNYAGKRLTGQDIYTVDKSTEKQMWERDNLNLRQNQQNLFESFTQNSANRDTL